MDDLTAKARDGDAEALGALFGQLHPLLVRIAHREIGRSHARLDADDLASEVMLRLIERFRDGQGPSENPVAYLARAIRNRVIDLRRAPAIGDVGADDFTALADAHVRVEDADEQRPTDVASELEIVAAAMARLPRRQRELLTAVAVDGMKPREIAAVTGEAANTVAAAASRARKALRVEIRRTMLEAEGVDACAAHREALAAEGTPVASACEHLDECARCRRALARFAALPALALVLPLVVLTQMVGGAASAHAAVEAGVAGGAGAVASGRRAPRSSRGVRIAGSVLLGLLVVAGVVAAFVVTQQVAPTSSAPVASPTVAAPAPTATEAPEPSAPPTAEPSDSAGAPEASTQANPASLTIDVAVGAGATTIAVDLGLRSGATVDSLRVDLPTTMRIVDAGAWRCPSTAGGGACIPPSSSADAVVLVVEAVDPGADVAGEATVDVAVVADGVTVAASSTGTIRVAP
ncbi:RNA polymerase sigma factor [Agrococcus jejuensis]|uniref:RNA polymerase sigma factor n=1 Tax=Agrococcus jejuensis TaxID=399736 RepID=UPI00156122D9|nr:sigma-70 family RNA polymerase sigma factor [Agrococcus jejuensis]